MGKKGWRLDYNPKKGMLLTTRKEKVIRLLKKVIPFDGNKDDFNRHLRKLNK